MSFCIVKRVQYHGILGEHLNFFAPLAKIVTTVVDNEGLEEFFLRIVG
jgi:hypothetical protein